MPSWCPSGASNFRTAYVDGRNELNPEVEIREPGEAGKSDEVWVEVKNEI
jgi:hypothetical protein